MFTTYLPRGLNGLATIIINIIKLIEMAIY